MFLYPASGLFSDGWAVTINNHNHNKLKSLLVYLFTTVISALGKQEWCRHSEDISAQSEHSCMGRRAMEYLAAATAVFLECQMVEIDSLANGDLQISCPSCHVTCGKGLCVANKLTRAEAS